MAEKSHLTPEACRAARAILKWSVRDLMREAGASPNTVTKFEGGGPIRPETAAKIVAAFERHGVEILNSGAPGARLHPERRQSPAA
jgi:transcriptional regulator with XRE-family HTH domain